MDALFLFKCQLHTRRFGQQALIEVDNHPHPYPLVWVNKDVEFKVANECKIKFSTSDNYIDEVEAYVVPLDVCGVVFGCSNMYVWNKIFSRRANQYSLIKDEKSFITDVVIRKYKIPLASNK